MRKRSVLLLALIAALVLSACSLGGSSEPPAGAQQAPEAGSAPTTGSAGNVCDTTKEINVMPTISGTIIRSR